MPTSYHHTIRVFEFCPCQQFMSIHVQFILLRLCPRSVFHESRAPPSVEAFPQVDHQTLISGGNLEVWYLESVNTIISWWIGEKKILQFLQLITFSDWCLSSGSDLSHNFQTRKKNQTKAYLPVGYKWIPSPTWVENPAYLQTTAFFPSHKSRSFLLDHIAHP